MDVVYSIKESVHCSFAMQNNFFFFLDAGMMMMIWPSLRMSEY